MNKQILKNLKLFRRHNKIRTKIAGTAECPRLNVFRSNKGMYLQLIDDTLGTTILSVDGKELKTKGTKTEKSLALGQEIAKRALAKNISRIVFDRGGYKYHGRVKAVADGARLGGLNF
jgi:large subunit ribosomal protein L18